MLIFVAGPYTADTVAAMETNVHTAMSVGQSIVQLGHVPLIPHLTHYWSTYLAEFGEDFDYEVWLDMTLAWLERCDALYFIAPSPGANIEVEHAKTLGKWIYFHLSDIPPAPWPAKDPLPPIRHNVPVTFK